MASHSHVGGPPRLQWRGVLGNLARLASASLLLTMAGCGRPPREIPSSQPTRTSDFEAVYNRHCVGCHGADGRYGPAPPHNDALFLAIIPEWVVSSVVINGRAETLMPAFGGEYGQNLRPDQVQGVVEGMFIKWGKPRSEFPATLPSYPVEPGRGNVDKGRQLFGSICAQCHGEDGHGGDAGPLNDGAFLELVSRQLIRRIAITGRPDLGMPDYAILGAIGGDGPLTSDQITDIVAYVESWRPPKVDTATQPAASPEPSP
jgi:cytochrome c oxidase cbb3-type subunit 3